LRACLIVAAIAAICILVFVGLREFDKNRPVGEVMKHTLRAIDQRDGRVALARALPEEAKLLDLNEEKVQKLLEWYADATKNCVQGEVKIIGNGWETLADRDMTCGNDLRMIAHRFVKTPDGIRHELVGSLVHAGILAKYAEGLDSMPEIWDRLAYGLRKEEATLRAMGLEGDVILTDGKAEIMTWAQIAEKRQKGAAKMRIRDAKAASKPAPAQAD
jgi:hypothetical protein